MHIHAHVLATCEKVCLSCIHHFSNDFLNCGDTGITLQLHLPVQEL